MAKVENSQGFHSTFRTFGKKGFNPQEWGSFFVRYDEQAWSSEGDGVLQYFDEDGKRYSLTIVHVPGRGFVLQIDCRSLKENKTLYCSYAVEDPKALSDFEAVADGLIYPRRCIVSPSRAWTAVKDFLTKPTEPSDRVRWVADEEIAWPER